MADRLIARLTATDPPQAEWVVVDGRTGAPATVEAGSLPSMASAARGRAVWLLAPAEDVLLTEAQVPARSRQQLLKALPYTLEDLLAEDLEALHFALGPVASGGRVAVAVVARARLEGWLRPLAEVGLQPVRVVPETLALPRADGEWRVLREGSRVLVRTGDVAGFAAEEESAGELLRAALGEAGEARPARAAVSGDSPATLALAASLAAQVALESQVDPEPFPTLALLARGVTSGPVIDLLQGPYDRRGSLAAWLRPWRASAALLLLWLGIEAGLKVVEYQRLQAEASDLSAQVESVFRRAMPGAQKMVNPRVQMERALKAQQTSADREDAFLSLLAGTGEVLREVPGAKLLSLGYRAGRLDVDLELTDLQTLDRLKQDLERRSGVEAGIQTVTAKDGRVQARLQVRGGGA